jgi:aquaporin NIP
MKVERTHLARAYLAEALGTFALVLVGAGAVMSSAATGAPDHTGVALSFGLVVMACVYIFGGVSGAHINPAVTLALAVSGHFPWTRVGPYVGAQCAGAISAAFTLRAILGPVASVGATLPVSGIWQSFGLEVLLTGFLMLAVMAVVSGPAGQRRFSGIIVGGVVALGAMWAGPLTGASMNPARSLGPALASGELGSLWIYLAAPIVGAIGAALLYQALLGRGRARGIVVPRVHDVGAGRPAAGRSADLGGSPTRP